MSPHSRRETSTAPQNRPHHVAANPSRFIGRVGALATALGIGAMSAGFGIATADTGAASAQEASTGASQATKSGAAGRRTTGRDRSRQANPTATQGINAPRVASAAASATGSSPLSPATRNRTASRATNPTRNSSPLSGSSSSPSTVPALTATAVSTPARAVTAVAVQQGTSTQPAATQVPSTTTGTTATSAPAAPALKAAPLSAVKDLVRTILSSLSGGGSGIPVESPVASIMLAAARRFVQQVRTVLGGGLAGLGQSASLTAAATTGTTTKITWAWGSNPVLNFNPATDKLDFGWMAPSAFDVTEAAGSTTISVVGNNHTYTLQGVPISALSMTNIIAKDSGTVSKWQNLITAAQSTPTVSIANATVAEGNSGTSTLGFTVSLSQAASSPVTVGYATANGTATAGSDYTATSGTLTFAPGVTSQKVNVSVIGDTAVEPTETFTVTLSSPSGAKLGTATATGTITNDDVAASLPSVSIANATVAEGNSGTSTLGFTVALSKASTDPVSVGYATAN
ncbi:MAG: hypothetical protein KDB71_13895, partial [Mycobacterium sp.]|nr:hypothetical protein [Mycobacterium sp.]